MTKQEMAARYTNLARRRTELIMHGSVEPVPGQELEERAILQEMAALETALRLPLEEETKIPEMLTIKEAAGRTGLSYYFLRKLCLQGRIAFIRVGGKYLVNMEKLADFLNGGAAG